MFKQLSDITEETIDVYLNGQKIQTSNNITVAALCMTQGLRFTRTTAISNTKRAPFCMMGVCYECLMVIDGKANQRACAITVKKGMKIETQVGVGSEIGEDVE
jgi:predicted molibdopterin-dependent oxidoreductase YjgC